MVQAVHAQTQKIPAGREDLEAHVIPCPEVKEMQRTQETARAILMCAGDYEPMEISVRPGDLVVGVDAGLPRLLAQGIEPGLVLGDFDSIADEYRPYLDGLAVRHPQRLLRLPREKDDTDTLYAARTCLERGFRTILIYGALGGRLDHAVANIQTLAWLRSRGAFGYLLEKRQSVTTIATVLEKERILLPEGFCGTFSLFALDSIVSGVTLRGMKYPLEGAVITNTFPIGVSNEVGSAGAGGSSEATARVEAIGRIEVIERGEAVARAEAANQAEVIDRVEDVCRAEAINRAEAVDQAEAVVREGLALMILSTKQEAVLDDPGRIGRYHIEP